MPIEVTVFCIAYNQEKYIDCMLKGIVEQKTNFRYEVLVHDDASSDGTPQIIQKYVEQYPDIIIPIYQNVNQFSLGRGIISSILVPLARGKYFAYCEGDVFWCDKYKLQKQYDTLESNGNCSICVHKTRSCNEDGSPNDFVFPHKRYGLKAGELDTQLVAKSLWVCGGFPFQLSSYFVRKEVYKENYQFLQEFWLDIAILWSSLRKGNFYLLDDIMSCYRMFSIGSWNMRFKESDNQAKIMERKQRIRMCYCYDELTKYAYHSYIDAAVVNNVLGWCTYDPKEASQIFKTINFSTNKYISKKNTMKYIMFSCSPVVLGTYQTITLFLEKMIKKTHRQMHKWWKNEKK